MASIQGIYIALFGRPADPIGLNYFNSITNNGQNLASIGNLAGQPEYLSRFEGMNNAQIVTSIYQELFGRNPDLAGLQFFTQQLNSGAQTINTIAINILDGAQGEDRALVNAKIAAADQFTAAVAADPDALAAYQGATGIAFGQSFLRQIDESTDTLTAEQVQAQVAAFGDGVSIPGLPGTPGDTFTLTTAVDNFVGTDGDDEFNAITGGLPESRTLNSFDKVDGGAGADTMNIISRGFADVAVPTGASVTNVETINVLNENANDVDAAGFQGAQQVWQIGGAGNIGGLAAGTTAGFRDTAVNSTVAYAAGVTAASVALDNVNAGATIDVDGAAVNTLTVSGSISQVGIAAGDYADLNLDISNDGAATNADITTLNLALTSNTDLAIEGLGAAELVTVDASGSTGGIRINLMGVGADVLDLESVTLGSGNDRVLFNNVASAADEASYDFGAGNDEIILGLQATGDTDLTIATGEGEDVITLQDSNVNVNGAGNGFEGSVTITDFAATSDSLLVEGFDGFTAQNLVNNAISGATSLYAAVAALDALLDVGGVNITDFAKFTYDGNTYLYGNVAGGGLDGDLLVGFTGVVDLNNDNVAQFV